MRFHRALGDPEVASDASIRPALGHESEDIELAWAERVQGRRPARSARHQRLHDLWIERGTSCCNPSQGFDEVVDVEDTILQQVPEPTSRGHDRKGVTGLDMLREEQNRGRRVLLADRCRRLQSLVRERRRHPNVDDRQIWLMFRHDGEEPITVADASTHLDPVVVEERSQPLTQQDRVVGDDYSHGRCTITTVPTPVGLRSSSSP